MNDEFLLNLKKYFNKDICLLDNKLLLLDRYYNFLIEYNKKINLTRITKLEEVYYKHFLDSIIPFKDYDVENKTLFDIGSGAGFPGIVLAIFFDTLNVVLCESIGKKATFLKELVNHLDIKNVFIFNGRAEDYNKLSNTKFDYITARAVSSIDNLFKYSYKLINNNTKLIFYKGVNYKEEIKNTNDKRFILNNVTEFVLPHNLGKRVCLEYIKK